VEGGSNFQEINTTQLVSVPYALHAKTAEQASNVDVIPVGTIMPFAGDSSSIPAGWLLCDGSALNPNNYLALATVLKTYWGDGTNDTDPLTSFNIPDMRGAFLRGVDNGKGYDSDRDLGSYQDDDFAAHNHNGYMDPAGNHGHSASTNTRHRHKITEDDGSTTEDSNGVVSLLWDDDDSFKRTLYTDYQGSTKNPVSVVANGTHTHTVRVGYRGTTETRPKNMAVNYIIKY
jgi:microcystin-dependent protein